MNNHNGNNRRVPGRIPQTPPRTGKRGRTGITPSIVFAALIVVAALVLIIVLIAGGCSKKSNGGNSSDILDVIKPYDTGGSAAESETEPDEPLTYTEITLLSAGDVMYHNPQLYEAYDEATGEYDFSPTYRYVKDLVSSADYAVVNFECTTAGDAFGYSGYPSFNAPDSGMSVLKEAGFDMLLFANNHCYDTGRTGLIRTQENFTRFGFDYVGARPDTNGKTYKTVDVKGIRLGVINSSDDLAHDGPSSPRTVNGIAIADGDVELMDLFNVGDLDGYYSHVEEAVRDLKAEGADLIVTYIHWGDEYQLVHNETQDAIAQKLCDLGVDVIIGSHPHVVQDAEVLTSTADPGRKTLCFYSLGNYVSNQNRLTMDPGWESEYTENGLTVILNIRKYSNGKTMVTDVKLDPTWVHRYTDGTTWKNYHIVIPLAEALNAPGEFGLYNSSFGVDHATAAYRMTEEQLEGVVEAFAATVSLPTGD